MKYALTYSVSMSYRSNIPNSQIPKTNRDQSLRNMQSMAGIMSKLLLSSTAAVSVYAVAKPVSAKTYFDITVYGDKELKIATVNKLKQKLRNAILQDISIAPALLRLALNDALGYDVNTEDGGADGSIQFEMNRPENSDLSKAQDVINSVKKDLLRTNVVTLSDVIAFAGSEALEAVGSNRIVVQVGRFDTNKENKKSSIIPWNDLSNVNAIKEAFISTGLDAKDIALLFGALGELERIIDETKASSKEQESEDEDDRPLDEEPFVPVTFGTRDAIYGAKVGKADFGVKYLLNILKKGGGDDKLAKILLEDAQVKSYVVKYSSNERAFVQDLADSYLKLTSVGKEFTNRNS